jgi:two-component system LytT family response regulator
MICSILCSRHEKVITETLVSRGMTPSEGAGVTFVEKGLPVPRRGISILYDPDDLNALVEFLDAFTDSSGKSRLDVLPVKSEDSYEIVRTEHVHFFTAEGNNVYCHTETGKYEIKRKLYEIERELAPRGFIRVNKSTIVNIMKVSEIAPWFGGRLLLMFKDREKDIEVSRNYVASFKNFLGL